MATSPNVLQLVITADPSAGNKAIQQFNSSLSGLEQQATRAGKGASDGLSSVESAAVKMAATVKESITGAFQNPLSAATGAVESFLGKFGTIGIVAGGVAAGLAVAAKSAFDFVRGAAEAAEGTVNLGLRMGITAGEAAVLEAQARIAGVGIDSFSMLVTKLSKTLTGNSAESKAAVRGLEEMGIKVVGANGQFRSSIDILRDFSAELVKIPDHAKQVALAASVFGKGAVEDFPLIQKFAELEEQAKKTGVGLDNDLIKRMAAVDEKMNALGVSWDRLKLKLAEKIVATVEFVQKGPGPTFDNNLIAAAGVTAFKSAAAGLGLGPPAELGGKLPSTSVGNPDPILASQQAEQNRRVAAGDNLVTQFRSRQSLAGLQDQLAEITRQQSEVESHIQSGATDTATQANIKAYDQLAAHADQLKAQIKDLEELPSRIEKATKFLEKFQGPRHVEPNAFAESTKADLEVETSLFKKRIQDDLDVRTARAENVSKAISQEEILATTSRDAQLRALDTVNAVTVQQKQAVEERKAAIEKQFLDKSMDIKTQVLDEDEAIEVAKAGDNVAMRLAIEEKFQLERRQLRLQTDADESAAIENAAIKSANIAKENTQHVFETLKGEAGGVFDALLTKSTSVWAAIGNSLKTALLTAIKDVVTSRIAAELTEVFTGQKVNLGGIGGNTLSGGNLGGGLLGSFGKLLGIGSKPVAGVSKLDQPNHLGDVSLVSGSTGSTTSLAVPVFIQNAIQGYSSPSGLPFRTSGASAALAMALGLGSFGGLAAAPASTAVPAGIVQSTINGVSYDSGQIFSSGSSSVFGGGSILGGPGGTPGFANAPLSTGGGSGVAGPGGGLLGNLKGLAGLKSLFFNSGGVNLAPGLALGPSGILGTLGGIASSPGAMMLSGLTAASTLGRPGAGNAIAGLASSTLLGFGIGSMIGPLGALAGAAIGAGVGAIGAVVSLLRKTPEQQIVDDVKSIYRLTIDKNFAKNSILPLINQSFGGNIKVGIRSAQVRQLLDLYAQTTGQPDTGLVPRATASVFANQGGVLSAQPVYTNGSPTSFSGGSAIGNGVSFGVASTPALSAAPAPQQMVVQNLTLSVGSDSLGALVDGRAASVIQSSGRLVSAAANEGQKASSARRETVASTLVPNYVVG